MLEYIKGVVMFLTFSTDVDGHDVIANGSCNPFRGVNLEKSAKVDYNTVIDQNKPVQLIPSKESVVLPPPPQQRVTFQNAAKARQTISIS